MRKRQKSAHRTAARMCPMCRGEVDASGQCRRCGAYVGGRDWEVHVDGTDAAEVQRVAERLSGRAANQASKGTRNPWAAGSFYLAVAVVMIAVLLTAAKM